MPFDLRQLTQVLGAAGGLRGNRGFQQRWAQLEAEAARKQQIEQQTAIQQEQLGFSRDANARAGRDQQLQEQAARLQQVQAFQQMLANADDETGIDSALNFVTNTAGTTGIDPAFAQSQASLFRRQLPQKRAERAYTRITKGLSPQDLDQLRTGTMTYDLDGQKVTFAQLEQQVRGMGVPPRPAASTVNAGSFEDYVIRYAKDRQKTPEQLTSADLEDARKRYQQADDRPRITVNTGSGLTPAHERRVNQLADAFRNDPSVKRTNVMAEAVSFVQSLDPNSKNAADDQALIYAFAKAMDPDSVVREGEYATVQKYAQSWLETFGFNAARVVNNQEFLSSQARANLKATIQKRYGATRSQYDNIRRQFATQINRVTGKADGDAYLVDYADAFPQGGQDAGAGATGRATVTPTTGAAPVAPGANPFRRP